MSAETIIRGLANLDPICRSHEGLDDGCLFCEAGEFGFGRSVEHKPDCLWVQAREWAAKENDEA